ncbi:TadE/TadG family type IV pilus assembly protein [Magnetospira sp. QH-2]|uniref:TadE/TadG family type IV pilus assembly protein n=1 Tax=Magnetospira sp. (strain QH-2) TaxID=1288970 RepID=UPI00130E3253|nr:TadE family protein [Magnetospira sp. QH-2]
MNNIVRRDDGVSAVEFALVMPMMILMLTGFVELGRAFVQAQTLEKGVRAAALFVARTDYPPTSANLDTARNLARKGTVVAAAPDLMPGWDSPTASLDFTYGSYAVSTDVSLPVIRVVARVPYVPIMPLLMSKHGLNFGHLEASHEQVHVGH